MWDNTLYWEQASELQSVLRDGDRPLASVEFDNGIQRWRAFDYTKLRPEPPGCLLLGPFDTQEEGQDAAERSALPQSKKNG